MKKPAQMPLQGDGEDRSQASKEFLSFEHELQKWVSSEIQTCSIIEDGFQRAPTPATRDLEGIMKRFEKIARKADEGAYQWPCNKRDCRSAVDNFRVVRRCVQILLDASHQCWTALGMMENMKATTFGQIPPPRKHTEDDTDAQMEQYMDLQNQVSGLKDRLRESRKETRDAKYEAEQLRSALKVEQEKANKAKENEPDYSGAWDSEDTDELEDFVRQDELFRKQQSKFLERKGVAYETECEITRGKIASKTETDRRVTGIAGNIDRPTEEKTVSLPGDVKEHEDNGYKEDSSDADKRNLGEIRSLAEGEGPSAVNETNFPTEAEGPRAVDESISSSEVEEESSAADETNSSAGSECDPVLGQAEDPGERRVTRSLEDELRGYSDEDDDDGEYEDQTAEHTLGEEAKSDRAEDVDTQPDGIMALTTVSTPEQEEEDDDAQPDEMAALTTEQAATSTPDHAQEEKNVYTERDEIRIEQAVVVKPYYTQKEDGVNTQPDERAPISTPDHTQEEEDVHAKLDEISMKKEAISTPEAQEEEDVYTERDEIATDQAAVSTPGYTQKEDDVDTKLVVASITEQAAISMPEHARGEEDDNAQLEETVALTTRQAVASTPDHSREEKMNWESRELDWQQVKMNLELENHVLQEQLEALKKQHAEATWIHSQPIGVSTSSPGQVHTPHTPTSLVMENIVAWQHIVFLMLSPIFLAIVATQRLSWRLRGRPLNSLNRLKPQKNPCKMPTYQAIVVIGRQIGFGFTARMFSSLQAERNIWLQANGVTRRHMLNYMRASYEVPWSLTMVVDGSHRPPLGGLAGTLAGTFMMSVAQFPDLWLSLVFLGFMMVWQWWWGRDNGKYLSVMMSDLVNAKDGIKRSVEKAVSATPPVRGGGTTTRRARGRIR